MDKVREAGATETGMKPKETLLRVDGEVVRGEPAIVFGPAEGRRPQELAF
jgi:hypothetical protein